MGRDLTLNASGEQVMQPVRVTANVLTVAVVPGSSEAWAGARGMMLHHSGSGGTWANTGPPTGGAGLPDGSPAPTSISSIALLPSGEGWGASGPGSGHTAFYHHSAGDGRWTYVHEDPRNPLPGNGLLSLSLWAGAGGAATGEAVGPGGALAHLSAGGWAAETPPDRRVAFTSVAMAGPEEAWAVGVRQPLFASNALGDPATAEAEVTRYLETDGDSRPLVYHRSAGGVWEAATVPQVGVPGAPTLGSHDTGPSLALVVGTTQSGDVWVGGSVLTQVATIDPRSIPGIIGGNEIRTSRTTEPFVARRTPDGKWRSHCASSGQTVSCDEPFPSASGLLSSIAPLPSGEVFMGGLTNGFYRGTPTGATVTWRPLPATVQPVTAIALSSPSEGVVASNGAALGTGIVAQNTFARPLIGHWTQSPEPSSMRRWPQMSMSPYRAVAADPAEPGRAMAVGDGGQIALLDADGWHAMPSPASVDLTAITWPRPEEAWAVGVRGTILRYDGRAWSFDARSGSLGSATLRGIAMPGAPPHGPAPRPTPTPTPTPSASPGPGTGATTARPDSPLWGWGRDGHGQVGQPPPATNDDRAKQFPSPQGVLWDDSRYGKITARDVSALSSSADHSVVVVGGEVYEFGDMAYEPADPGAGWSVNNPAKSGPGFSPTPQRVDLGPAVSRGGPGGTRLKVTRVAAGPGYALALVESGALYAWGTNESGVLGVGDPTVRSSPTPVPVQMPPNAGTVTAMSAGAQHALAIAGDIGQVYAWGQDPALPAEGQAGNVVPGGRVQGFHPRPQPIPNLTGATMVSAGGDGGSDSFSAALVGDATVKTWGSDCSRQLGYSSPPAPQGGCPVTPVPTAVPGLPATNFHVTDISAGGGNGYVLLSDSDGNVWGWGDNSSHQLLESSDSTVPPQQIGVGRLPRIDRVAAGDSHSLALSSTGTVYAWGNDLYGELGYPVTCAQVACGTPQECAGRVPDAFTSSSPYCGVPQMVPGLTGRLVAAGSALSMVAGSYVPPSSTTGTDPGGGGASPAAPPADGFAVGDAGTILAHDAAGWRLHPASGSITSHALTAVTATGLDFVAVGDGAPILSSDGSAWFPALRAAGLADQANGSGLTTLASFPDGTVFAAGVAGAFLERPPDGCRCFQTSRLPSLGGAVTSLSLRRDPDGLHGLATVGGSDPEQGYGWVMAYDSDTGQWRDVEHGWVHAASADPGDADTAVLRDAAAGVVFDSGHRGLTAWAVGGAPQFGTGSPTDDELHSARPTSSVWRLDLAFPPPDPPGVIDDAPLPAVDPAGVSFAFLGNTGCLGGFCNTLLGAGSHGDGVAVEAMRAVLRAKADGTVGFAVTGGDLRARGDEGSLQPFARLLASAGMPVYAALGARDLQVDPSSRGTTSAPWRSVFVGAAGPWGEAAPPPGFSAVDVTHASRRPGAATHYAVDYMPRGRSLIRLIVLDTSVTPIARNAAEQNPHEDQTAWLAAVLRDAAAAGIPPVVVMNRPVMPPAAVNGEQDGTITSLLAGSGIAGVLATEPAMNRLQSSVSAPGAPGGYPIGVFGAAGGSPIAYPRSIADGGYHSWQLVTVSAGRMSVRSIPILESVAIHAAASQVQGGAPIRVTGLGRLPDVGTTSFLASGVPPLQDIVSTLPFPYPIPCGADHPGGGGKAACRASEVAPPDYHFLSEHGHLVPVREDPDHPGRPLIIDGHSIVDDTSGVLCGLSAGEDAVDLLSGGVGARVAVTVTAGDAGQCGVLPPPPPPVKPPGAQRPAPARTVNPPGHPAPPAPAPAVVPPAPAPAPPPEPRPLPARVLSQRHVHAPLHPVGVAVAPPVPEVIPAPPGGLSAASEPTSDDVSVSERQEEEEPVTVGADASSFTRAHHPPRDAPTWQQGTAELASAALGAWLLAVPAARRRRQVRARGVAHLDAPGQARP